MSCLTTQIIPVPAAAAAAAAGIRFIQSPAGARQQKQLFDRIAEFTPHSALPSFTRGLRRAGRTPHFQSAILPIIIGDEAGAVAVAAALRERGIFVPAIRYPTVARGQARLRVTLTAAHTPGEIHLLVSSLNEIVNRKIR
jgi:7-keto-8-aminopelargonate synthetase-like enzyme